MCGIFGVCHYCHKTTIGTVAGQLINGLKRLEYRGYDSAGICVQTTDNKRTIVKRKGNVQVLKDAVFGSETAKKEDSGLPPLESQAAGVGMAHTRWATHGPPCDKNAHPVASDDAENSFVIIHNGIMTNFNEMKSFLQSNKYEFKTDTDTEVIANLSHYLYSKKTDEEKKKISFVSLMAEVCQLLEGANAIIVMSKFFPGELVVFKRGSPMICGYSEVDENGQPVESYPSKKNSNNSPRSGGGGTGSEEGGNNNPNSPTKPPVLSTTVDHAKTISGEGIINFQGPCSVYFASDPSAIAEHTKQVVYLDDDDMVHFKQGALAFYKLDGSLQTAVGRNVQELELALESLSKGGYAHFMLKEIYEQVQSVVNSMRGRISFVDAVVKLGGFTSKSNRNALLSARRIMFIACGTSLNACIAVRPLFDELAGCPTAVENASDFLDRSPRIFRDDVCFFVSQSGETADVLRALEYCRDAGAVLVGMTNTVGSSISRMTHFGAHLNCGPEIGVASTKAFTSQIVVLTLLALQLADDSISHQTRRSAIVRGLEQLSSNIDKALRMSEETVKKVAASFVSAKSLLIIGRGYQYATCLEAALKVKELSYIHTEGINAGELKHGPLALIDENIPVIVICTKDHLVERSRAAVQQIRARNGKPIVILSDPDPEVEKLAEAVIRVPATVDCLQVIVNAIPMQLLAYHVAVLRGNNVDCPRNLAKSVTVQ